MAREKKISLRRISVADLAAETKLGSQALTLNDDEVIRLLRAAVEREGNQGAFARRHGGTTSPSLLNAESFPTAGPGDRIVQDVDSVETQSRKSDLRIFGALEARLNRADTN